MKNKISIYDISGGDSVLLKDGRIIKVHDVHLGSASVVGSAGEWYPVSDVVEITERFRGNV